MQNENDYGYTGLHAFVFIDRVAHGDTPRNVVARLRELGGPPTGPVFFAAEVVGKYLAFAHLRVEEEDDLAGLLDLISGELWERGVHCSYCIEGDVYRHPITTMVSGTKRSTPEIIALVSIVVERGRVHEVLERLGEVAGFKGASVVSGDFDILLQLGGDTLSDVLGNAMTDLQGVEGVVHTSTAFADGTR